MWSEVRGKVTKDVGLNFVLKSENAGSSKKLGEIKCIY